MCVMGLLLELYFDLAENWVTVTVLVTSFWVAYAVLNRCCGRKGELLWIPKIINILNDWMNDGRCDASG